mgnify:CR=1 FL=1
MKKKSYIKIAKKVIELEINALRKLKKNLGNPFNETVKQIAKCSSKIIFCGVGKSGLIASKIAATMSSIGAPSFSLSASDSSHGDLGSISKKDILILISNSGETNELRNIIKYAKRNKILIIGIVSKKDSILHKSAEIKLLTPKANEAEGIVPTASTTTQLALGDSLAIASMKYKKFGKLDFKKLHPAGSLGAQLKTVEDIMITGEKIPFVNENMKMKQATKILSKKGLGCIIIRDNKKKTKGIITDGQIRRSIEHEESFQSLPVKRIMTRRPISIDKNELAAKALNLMNTKQITVLLVNSKKNSLNTIGVLHIHTILKSNIS